MPRRIIFREAGGPQQQLLEVLAENEAELQTFLVNSPELFPIEEIGLMDSIMVVGKESTVPSGSIDMLAMARTGEILVIEFKTGPGNPDFRHVLAQLFDYGSHLWGMSYEQFEAVAVRFFNSERCSDPRLRSKTSLGEAATATWSDFSEEESGRFQDSLARNLSAGDFYYIIAAQDFTPEIRQTVEYLNVVLDGPKLFGVEIIKFQGEAKTAFEARTVLKPSVKAIRPLQTRANESSFLGKIEDAAYSSALKNLFDLFRELGLRFEWGAVGGSVRAIIEGSPVPLTLGWFFPPGRTGWMGMTDLTLGYSTDSQALTDGVKEVLGHYVSSLGQLIGGQPESRGNSNAYRFDPDITTELHFEIEDIFRRLVKELHSNGE